MELVTASDLVVTASLALLLSFLVAKLVSLAMTTDPHAHTTTSHVNDVSGDRLTAQTESKVVEFLSPLQVATTNVETEHNGEKEVTVESNVVVELPVTPDIAVELELSNVEEESNEETELLVPQAVSAEQENTENTECACVEEISVEPLTKGISVVEEKDVALDDDDDDDDDWEGIERSELEKVFMAATEVVGSSVVGSDVQMEFYGLHKVATEGPCRQPQPMPLMLSARAKWNAWQKLGNMSPEVAMEQYISLLSDKVPGWMKDTSAGISEHGPTGSEVSESAAPPDLSTSLSRQQMVATERELEHESGAQDHSQLTELDLENNVKK